MLGIIPARGGSKGVRRKNLRLVAGRPLIAYAIAAARESRMLTEFVVSTEDVEIATIVEQLGALVVRRPAELAAAATPILPVVQHVLAALEPERGRFDYLVVLQPTAPQRSASDIDAALALLMASGADSVVSVYQVADHHPARMYRLVDGRLVSYETEPGGRLRQTLPPVYHRNGAIYACRRDLVDTWATLIGPDARPYIMPRERSINIDDEFDLMLVDFLMRRQRSPASR